MKLLPSQKLKICNMYVTDGLGSDTIAKKFNIHPNTVLKILKKNNIKTRDWKRKIPLTEHNNICVSYKNGDSAVKIAKHYNVTAILKILEKK